MDGATVPKQRTPIPRFRIFRYGLHIIGRTLEMKRNTNMDGVESWGTIHMQSTQGALGDADCESPWFPHGLVRSLEVAGDTVL